MIHSEIIKFWSGEGISFFEQECCVPRPDMEGYLKGYRHMLYCRNVKESEYGSKYTVIAKTLPYLTDEKPIINKYEMFYLNNLSPKKYWTTYSEDEILRIIRLKTFL